MNEDLKELLAVVDRIREKVGEALALPTDVGQYALVRTEDSLPHRVEVDAWRYEGGDWDLGGESITSEGLRRYLETYRLRLVHVA